MQEQNETLQFEGDLLTYLSGKYFTVYMMIGNNKALWIFWAGAHSMQYLSFLLRTPLLVVVTSSLPTMKV